MLVPKHQVEVIRVVENKILRNIEINDRSIKNFGCRLCLKID